MPPFPKDSPKPRRTKPVPPPSREALFRAALVAMLRRVGLIDLVVPADMALLALAKDFSNRGSALADDKGKLVGAKPFDLNAWQASLPAGIDEKDIPF